MWWEERVLSQEEVTVSEEEACLTDGEMSCGRWDCTGGCSFRQC